MLQIKIRVAVGMILQLVVLLTLPFLPLVLSGDAIPQTIIALMGVIGIACWICHGTASQLCGMFPPSSVAFLQTGFCAPQVGGVGVGERERERERMTRVHP
jgi:hypothetical protein